MPDPTPHRCPMPTTEEPAPSTCCLMLIWISSRIVIAAMPPVASNLQSTTHYGPAVNAAVRIRSWLNRGTARPRWPRRWPASATCDHLVDHEPREAEVSYL